MVIKSTSFIFLFFVILCGNITLAENGCPDMMDTSSPIKGTGLGSTLSDAMADSIAKCDPVYVAVKSQQDAENLANLTACQASSDPECEFTSELKSRHSCRTSSCAKCPTSNGSAIFVYYISSGVVVDEETIVGGTEDYPFFYASYCSEPGASGNFVCFADAGYNYTNYSCSPLVQQY